VISPQTHPCNSPTVGEEIRRRLVALHSTTIELLENGLVEEDQLRVARVPEPLLREPLEHLSFVTVMQTETETDG